VRPSTVVLLHQLCGLVRCPILEDFQPSAPEPLSVRLNLSRGLYYPLRGLARAFFECMSGQVPSRICDETRSAIRRNSLHISQSIRM
jgi:hypothetical protein